jgi:hypothetical protein
VLLVVCATAVPSGRPIDMNMAADTSVRRCIGFLSVAAAARRIGISAARPSRTR